MTGYYDPDGRPITVEQWARMFEQRHHTTGMETWWCRKTEIGNFLISTVWIGLDHSFLPGDPPLFWETMIFGDDPDEEQQWRYSSRAQAYDHHEELVKQLRARVGGGRVSST